MRMLEIGSGYTRCATEAVVEATSIKCVVGDMPATQFEAAFAIRVATSLVLLVMLEIVVADQLQRFVRKQHFFLLPI